MQKVVQYVREQRLLSKAAIGEVLASPRLWLGSSEAACEVFHFRPFDFVPDQPKYTFFLRLDGEVLVLRQCGMTGVHEWYVIAKSGSQFAEPVPSLAPAEPTAGEGTQRAS
jgi:hypothetical protein